jgi:hypothetical protein
LPNVACLGPNIGTQSIDVSFRFGLELLTKRASFTPVASGFIPLASLFKNAHCRAPVDCDHTLQSWAEDKRKATYQVSDSHNECGIADSWQSTPDSLLITSRSKTLTVLPGIGTFGK